jgi:5-(hydroxymethyl)furfural/furfural oxidase
VHVSADRTFDYIIVGAGTAGCVLAGRLSSKPGNEVLLIEAGRDTPPGQEPATIRDCYPRSYGDAGFFWPDLIAEVGADRGDGQPPFARSFEQARVMGGGSAIMGMVALRGTPADYDEWAESGADGWRWDDVLPYFKRLENDLDFRGPLHGADGPIPIRRHASETWPPFCRAVGESLVSRGYGKLADLNGEFHDGVGPVPMSNRPEGRVSSAMGYLGAAARRRPNLHILTDAFVERLVFDGSRTTGVMARTANGVQHLRAKEVVVAAGAIHSPTLLLRSGVGPAADLQRTGVQPIENLRGVGANLQNHPLVTIAVHLKPHAVQPAEQRAWGQNCLRFSSREADCPASDMLMFAVNKTSWHPLGRRIASLGVGVYKSFSRGTVALRSPDPAIEPQVRFRLLSDERDGERLIGGVALAASVLADPRVEATRNEVFLPDGAIVRRLNRPRFDNWCQGFAISVLLGSSGALRRTLLRRATLEPARLASDRGMLRDIVLRTAGPMGHVAGTCRMGRASDPHAVVDSRCRVHGVGGLRVVDGSVMPAIVRANTNLPITMIAEKAADAILEDVR